MRDQKNTVHLASKVDVSTLVLQPEIIMQQMSMKIFKRRQEFLDSLVNTRVTYDISHGAIGSGMLIRYDNDFVICRDGDITVKVPFKRLHL